MTMWKTTVVIWTDYDPAHLELDRLAHEACRGDAYCSKQHTDVVENVGADPDWDGTDFFGIDQEAESK